MHTAQQSRQSRRQPARRAAPIALPGLLALLALLVAPAGATAELLLAQSGDASAYRQTREALLGDLSARWQIRDLGAEWNAGETTAARRGEVDGDIATAIGSDACTRLHRELPDTPLLCLLLPRANFNDIIATPARAVRSALYIDQPALRQLRVARHLFPQLRRFSLLYDAAKPPPLLDATTPGIELIAHPLAADDNLLFSLRRALRDSDALLAIPDKRVYNRRSLRSLLLTAYRARKPMIGYAKPFVKAGALMSLHTRPAALGSEAAGLLESWLDGTPLPQPGHPRHYAIAINPGIARALALPIDAADYHDRLYAAEELP